MTSPLQRWALRAAGAVTPRHIGRCAALQFMTPRRHWPAEPDLPPPDARADLPDAVLRRWGRSGPPVYLLHGWDGHYTQFAPLIAELLHRGASVVTIDPPGHGDMVRGPSHPLRFVAALQAALAQYGPARAVVGHSMGGGAVLLAVGAGLITPRIALVAAPADFGDVVRGFATYLGLGAAATRALAREVTTALGQAPASLAIDRIPLDHLPPTLVVHDRQDRRVPLTSAQAIARAHASVALWPTEGLGHVRILGDAAVISRVAAWVDPSGSPNNTGHDVAPGCEPRPTAAATA